MDNLETQAILGTNHREKTNKTKSTTQKIARTPLKIRRLTQRESFSCLFLDTLKLRVTHICMSSKYLLFRHHEMVEHNEIPLSQLLRDMLLTQL
jgi:hypothetical protein